MSAIDIATTYLDALVRRDAAEVPLSTDARRIVNGRESAEGADALRDAIGREPPLTIAAPRRWIGGDDEVVVFYDLAADMGQGAPIPVTVGERFVIRDDVIHEIVAVHATTPGVPTDWAAAAATGPADEAVAAAARSYLDALVSHRAGAVVLADHVRRIENGARTGSGATDLRESLESDVMQMVQGITDEHWVVAGDSAAVFYTLAAGAPDDSSPVLIAERFRTERGALSEIEAVFAAPSRR